MQKHLLLIGLLTCISLSFSPREVENRPTTIERQPERGSGRKELMDKTFIKTSVGIIRIEHISYITEYKFAATGDDIIMIHFTNGDDISLAGKEARSFLQFIPIAVDITYLAKEESGVEIAGLKM